MKKIEIDQELDAENQALLLAAMLAKGWKLPTTAEEVAFVESRPIDEHIEIPESLRSASEVFEAIQKPPLRRKTLEAIGKSEANDNLALAAREGGSISDETRRLMDQDRASIEDGKDVDGEPS